MASPVLFHGPLARHEAVTVAASKGRMISDPIGDGGLKVDDSRRIVSLAGMSGIGDKRPVIVVGPLDQATPEAADALLKTLEDLSEGPLLILLWTDYLGGVIGTIRSRTSHQWCPPNKGWTSLFVDEHSEGLYEAWAASDAAKVMEIIYQRQRDWKALLQGFCEVLAERSSTSKRAAKTWLQVRHLLDGKGSHLIAATALLDTLEEGAS